MPPQVPGVAGAWSTRCGTRAGAVRPSRRIVSPDRHDGCVHAVYTVDGWAVQLEALHNPALRTALDTAGEAFRIAATAMLAAAGSSSPARHGRLLVAVCDGILFDALAGAGSARPPTRAELRDGIAEVPHAC